MSDITQRSTLKNKKRYIAIAALAGLVATGGVIGATVTSESTIANNQITITEKPGATDAVITVAGSPINWSYQTGDGTNGVRGFVTSQSYTITNTGETDATVLVQPVEDLMLESTSTQSVDHMFLTVQVGSGGDTSNLLQQKISNNPGDYTTVQRALTVPAGQSVTIKGGIYDNSGVARESLRPTDVSFDLQFDYVNKQ